MEGTSRNAGVLLYHEVQESKLCAVHCLNAVLQGPFFSEFDLAAVASDLDLRERQLMTEVPDQSHNVALDGDFSIQVLDNALQVWDLHVVHLDKPIAERARTHPELEDAFICHIPGHWFCIRKVNEEWYNFDSLNDGPQQLSKFHLSAYLSTLKGAGWSIYVVRGNFPKECPDASNEYGQWLTPEEAERIKNSRNGTSDPYLEFDGVMLGDEDEDLKAAIAASLMDSLPQEKQRFEGCTSNESVKNQEENLEVGTSKGSERNEEHRD